MTIRNEFEQWWKEQGFGPGLHPEGDGYFEPSTHIAWLAYAAGQRAEASKDSREAFMCLVDYEHELGFASGAHKVYGAVEDLRDTRPCVEQCGIARVRVVLEEVVQQPDYSTAEPLDDAAIRNRKEQG